MHPITLLILFLAALVFMRTPLFKRHKMQFLLGGGAAILIFLVATGKMHAIYAVAAAAIPIIQRFAMFARYIPGLAQLYTKFKQQSGQTQGNTQPPAANQSMTREQAAEILGVAPDASEQEIKVAHRKLMGKLHPDKGGNDFLAGQLNQARDRLLS